MLTVVLFFLLLAAGTLSAAEKAKVKGLLITGGCCHDYEKQKVIISEGFSQRFSIAWDIVHANSDRNTKVDVYNSKDWAKGYDLVVHNECYGGVTDVDWVQNIVNGHIANKIPALFVHCSAHSYRHAKTDEWRKLLGVKSMRHEKGGRVLNVTNKEKTNPIMKHFPESWKTPNGELYVIENIWPTVKPLATAYGEDTKTNHLVMWTNEYQNVKVFATTLGHHNETMQASEWLETVSRGALWTLGLLEKDGRVKKGYEGTGITKFSFEKEATGEPTPAKAKSD
tara:strand:- start:2324 stop:3169 length:846 start_codon:yes stop_codon:yes gene_type:complete